VQESKRERRQNGERSVNLKEADWLGQDLHRRRGRGVNVGTRLLGPANGKKNLQGEKTFWRDSGTSHKK